MRRLVFGRDMVGKICQSSLLSVIIYTIWFEGRKLITDWNRTHTSQDQLLTQLSRHA
jgi:hypothetical protein